MRVQGSIGCSDEVDLDEADLVEFLISHLKSQHEVMLLIPSILTSSTTSLTRLKCPYQALELL